ncbi:MAG: hypothetical protein GX575_31700 [Candidatus Anammoximicrobium sp.]|nr:hypothetical protein [Candidatus Anammoximicrobium sp.]
MPRPKEINVTIFGKKFARFVLIDDQGRYWTRLSWSERSRDAVMYYDVHLAQAERRKLLRKQRRRKT